MIDNWALFRLSWAPLKALDARGSDFLVELPSPELSFGERPRTHLYTTCGTVSSNFNVSHMILRPGLIPAMDLVGSTIGSMVSNWYFQGFAILEESSCYLLSICEVAYCEDSMFSVESVSNFCRDFTVLRASNDTGHSDQLNHHRCFGAKRRKPDEETGVFVYKDVFAAVEVVFIGSIRADG
ncbi:hypothetical protein BCR34DRAFT_591467 [Clohesyomyces aquaticus]|uniref:Uncharacterized protein n=1 Tax=Clohesyomyces aquaticus TaxID=1231657 RepID=A0A1Y1Z0P0_9PLEO|nr:hypothetical protein BCR34DRAFT_591467 [Clohesyomyces aquaticus]